MSSGYHNLKHDKKIFYLNTVSYQYDRYRFIRLPFRVTPVTDIFQQKIDEIFKGLPNMFGTADDIFTVTYDADGRANDNTLRPGMDIFQEEDMKLNRNKCHYSCIRIPFLGVLISRNGVQPDPEQLHILITMPTLLRKMSYHPLRHNKLLRKVLTHQLQKYVYQLEKSLHQRVGMEYHT